MLAGVDTEFIKLKELYYRSGGKLPVPESFGERIAEINSDLKNQRYISAVVKAPFATLEATMKPLFKHYIPAIKVSSFYSAYQRGLDIYADKLASGEMTEGELARKMFNHMEYVFGKMSKDNLFWDKNLEFAVESFIRSTTYTLGTAKVMGGAVKDTGKFAKNLLTGKFKDIEFTQEQATAISIMALTALAGAMYQKTHTIKFDENGDVTYWGDNPDSLKDLFFPKNGEEDENGNPRRTKMIGYGTEAIAWGRHPIKTAKHKLAPLLTATAEFITNEDYFGDMVRNPNASASAQVYQVLRWAMEKIMPWSILQEIRNAENDLPLWKRLESFGGWLEAPAEWRQSKAEKLIYKMFKNQSGIDVSLTPERKMENKKVKRALKDIKSENPTFKDFNELVETGKIRDPNRWMTEGMLSYSQRIFKKLSPKNQIKALSAMTEKERIRYLPLRKKALK